jgi:sulfur-oxidizing protein SoxY
MNRTSALFLSMLFLGGTAAPALAAAGDTDAQRQAHWQDLRQQVFGDKMLTTDERAIQLDTPMRAEDASLVPVTITLANPKDVKAVYLVIDDNPSPVAAHFTFGPEADPQKIKMRVRVNSYTDMHAVVETKGGKLLMTTKFVKAAGGCSAPMGMSDEAMMSGMGEMKLKLGDMAANKPVDATLMVRHPNFNGMQMNQVSHLYTPARYIQNIDVTYNNKQVFNLDTDISLATNPVISFAMQPSADKGVVKVSVKDSEKGQWSKNFDVPPASN